MLSKEILDIPVPDRKMTYTWRDVVLYALAVGAKEDDLQYTYEKCLKTVPTFGVLPAFSTLGVEPFSPCASDPTEFAKGFLEKRRGLHYEQELILHRSIYPLGGTLYCRSKRVALYDRGEGKGAVIKKESIIYDEVGNAVCTNNISMILLDGGGFGGDPPPSNEVIIPDREPDHTVEDFMPASQGLLYRLTGDLNPIHINPEDSRRVGAKRPFVHGLCSFGFACRMGIEALIPGEPERLTRISAQMRSILYPGTRLKLLIWRNEDNKAFFRLVADNSDKPILERGLLEWK